MTKLTNEQAEKVLAGVRAAQEEAGLTEIQGWIESGQAWKLEGAVGRAAMNHLETGECFLPTVSHRDAYGNKVPSRDELKPGSKGTLENSARFYEIEV
jgi:hypothetical protein